jgi:hypothetical protein
MRPLGILVAQNPLDQESARLRILVSLYPSLSPSKNAHPIFRGAVVWAYLLLPLLPYEAHYMKPCEHISPDPNCRVCYWCQDCSETGRAYRQMWGESEPDCSGPSLARKIFNFGKAVVGHVATGAKEAPEEVIQARLAICAGCEYFDKEQGVCKHKRCGCNMQRKTRWAEAACPLDPPKWGPYKPPTLI